ncbi:hypothetical protein VCR14J2_610427 [Vibrio coralliirubri]|nr:hypothetical protein VCR1J2_20140 [Vibrio coralliirubri]CDT60202.1 hypothetical protein VCR6J2_610206 [Vibrio coralliirubri]CDT65908.1 hypothetical protein VCR15J2_470344 [Vibrio coralliirubri]CDT69846.1 hypothetical protein VCR26J2_350357 [Vibrio coralliirubri]CDT84016.1 hypothetical protein VCR8J2_240144 [Vibrio coralliirubri]
MGICFNPHANDIHNHLKEEGLLEHSRVTNPSNNLTNNKKMMIVKKAIWVSMDMYSYVT